MNADQISKAAEAVGWLAEQALQPGEEASARTQMGMTLLLAQSYLLEYAVHVLKGADPYDALMTAARGDTDLTQRQKNIFRAMQPPAP